MKIKRFIGKKVWGYMDFDISFNDGLNFLIGVNGTGKTTVLRLLRWLLIPKQDVQNDIEYQTIDVECNVKGEKINIDSDCTNNTLVINDTDTHVVKSKNYTKGISSNETVSFLELDRLNNFAESALKEVREMIYAFVRSNVSKKNKIEDYFRSSVLSLSKNEGKDIAIKLQELDYEYTQKINKLKQPLNRFVNSANLFFSEGDKVLHIDDAGEISIEINGGEKSTTIFDLSSGEKQLIIMLGHIVFDEASVFVIDEPELSLHLSWQYKFAEALQTANPDAQFILATHAAGIIAKKSNEQYCIDLTPKKND